MYRKFDAYNVLEQIELTLCNPDGTELYVMPHALHIKAKYRYNGYSEIEFEIPKEVNGEKVAYYDLVQQLRRVRVDGFAEFVITSANETRDGVVIKKQITCLGIDSLFGTRNLVSYEGTYKLWDAFGGESIMSKFLSVFTDWKLIHVDDELTDVSGTFDISEQNWYDFLMNDVEEFFECVFIFDTLNKEISIKTTKNAIKKCNLFVSFENFLKEININTVTDGIKSALEVYGRDGLSIHDVNPLGSTIYNFNYFKTTDWMSQDTIDAINAWETKVNAKQVEFANNNTQLKEKMNELLGYQIKLTELNNELKALEGVQIEQASAGVYDNGAIYNKIQRKKDSIRNCKNSIESVKKQIEDIDNLQDNIRNEVSIRNKANFNDKQLKEIDSILSNTTGTYTNSFYVKTSKMSDVEVQEEAQRLYNLSLTVLEKESQPRCTFTSNVVNFYAIKEVEQFGKELDLGCEFALGIDDNTVFYPVLLEFDIDYDDISSVDMTFSNSLRLSNDQFDFASIFKDMQTTVNSVSTSKGLWEDYLKSGDKESFNNFKNSALDLKTKEIISTSGQNFTIDQNGIRGRKLLPSGDFSLNELWVSNNSIVMTSNGWQSSSLAIGEIDWCGVKKYGIAASLLIGDIIAGQNLIIKNEKNTVTIDSNGIKATNADINLLRSDGMSQTTITSNGINIKSKIGGSLTDVFYVDGGGNLNFKGNLTGASGTFSGKLSGCDIEGGSLNIGRGASLIRSDGSAKFTNVEIDGGEFVSGRIRGTVIMGTTINGGTINGTQINGVTINTQENIYVGKKIFLEEGSGTGIYSKTGGRILGVDDWMGVGVTKIYSDFPWEFNNYVDAKTLSADTLISNNVAYFKNGATVGSNNDRLATEKWVLENSSSTAVFG